MDIEISISKTEVMQEVAKTTSYTAAKMDGAESPDAFRRISTVDEDEAKLEMFWEECRAEISQELIGLVEDEGMDGDSEYRLTLNVSRSFDSALLPGMRISLFSYFVQAITGKWFVFTNKKEAGEYADKAATLLDDIHRKAVYKKKPTRPTYQ